MGSLNRHSNKRILQMKADPSCRLVGCLVSRYWRCGEWCVCKLCGVQSAAVLEVFMVRSKEEREKAVKRKRKKAQKRSVKEGTTPVEVRD